MKKFPVRILTAVLCLLACSVVLVPYATASDPCMNWEYPSAYFTFEVAQTETLPMTVEFTDASHSPAANQLINRRNWDFGDGTTSTERNPRHTYSIYQDHFDVCLRATTVCGGHDTECKQVTVQCTEPRAGFIMNVSEGPAPLAVRITDTSEHTPESATSWLYTKDGNTIEREKRFEGTFTTPGVYTIRQTVKKNCNPNSDSYSRELRVSEPIAVYTIMNLSYPTITPTIAVLGMFFNISNATAAATTTVPTTTARPLGYQAPYTLVTTSRTATAFPTSLTVSSSGTQQNVPAAAGTGTLSVITTPAGAQVFVDEVPWGASPATIPNLAAGAHNLRLEMAGYQNLSVPVAITDGKTSEYSLALVPVSSGGMGMLPLLAGAVVILVLAAAGGYLYLQKKKAP
jgi:PKD repeat protein